MIAILSWCGPYICRQGTLLLALLPVPSSSMSLLRVLLVAAQSLGNQRACTPPNPTPSQGRYHTEELYILQIAPLVFKVQILSLKLM